MRRLAPVLIALLTAAVFAPALGNGFVWDDSFNVVDNPHLRGFGWAQLRWMLTAAWSGHPGWGGQWIPLTWASLALDHLLWGLSPRGYHLTNIVLHAANAGLCYLVARRVLAIAVPAATPAALALGAAAAALFFGVHPLRAESVAWVTERRDVLSGFFLLLAVLGYLAAIHREAGRRRRWLVGSLTAYAAALASKPTAMTLPLVLLVLDAYPLRRLRGAWPARFLEKAPYLLLAGAIAALTLDAVHSASVSPLERYPVPARVAMAFWATAHYARTTLLPVGLSPLYEAPALVDVWSAPYVASALAVILVTLALLAARRRWPAGLAVWAAFLIMLAPASGLVHVGHHQAGDRYTYLPSLAPALLVGGAVVAFLRLGAAGSVAPGYARLALVGVAAWLTALGLLAQAQTRIWRDSDTLWSWAATVDPACGLCQGNLGVALWRSGRLAAALPHLERARALQPEHLVLHRNLGLAQLEAGRTAEAVETLRAATVISPRDADVRHAAGFALARAGRLADAVEQFRAAAELAPTSGELLLSLAAALADQGRLDEAREYAQRAVALNPASRRARRLLEGLSARSGPPPAPAGR